MSRVLTLSNNGYVGKKAKYANWKIFKLGPVSSRVIAVLIITVLALLYLAQSQNGATKGYEIRDLKEEEATIEEQNQELNIRASRLRAIRNIQNGLEKLDLVPSEGYTYLR